MRCRMGLFDPVSTLSYFLTARLHVFICRRKEKGHRQVSAASLKVSFNHVEKKPNHVQSSLPTVNHHKCVVIECRKVEGVFWLGFLFFCFFLITHKTNHVPT